MLKEMIKFEFGVLIKSPLSYFLLLVFFSLALVMMIGTGGYFDGPIKASNNIRLLNTPYELTYISQFFIKLLLVVVPIIVGQSLYKDYNSKMYTILYSYPIHKKAYLFSKLISSLTFVFFIAFVICLAMVIGESILGSSNPKIAPFSIAGYVHILLLYYFPNILIVGILVFVVVGYTRNVFAGFIVVIVLFLLQLIVQNVFFNNLQLLTALDPFGQNAFMATTKDWNLIMKNSNQLPMGHLIWINRLVWLTIASFLFSLFYRKFDFQYDTLWQGKLKFKRAIIKESLTHPIKNNLVPSFRLDHSMSAQWNTLWYLSWYTFRSITKNAMFYVLAGFGVLTIFFIQIRVTETGDFNLLPYTRILVKGPFSIYEVLLIMITFLYTGIVVNQAKSNRFDSLIDVTSVQNWQLTLSKVLSIALMQLTLLGLFLFCCLGIQMYHGFYDFQLGLFAYRLFVLSFPVLLVWNLTSIFIHTLIPNVYAGIFILIMIWLAADNLDHFGLESQLLKFNQAPRLDYSDLSGFGHYLSGYFSYQVFWILFSIVLLVFSFLLWERGVIDGLKSKWKLALSRISLTHSAVLILCLLMITGLGFKLVQEEQADAKYLSALNKGYLKSFKSEWGKYDALAKAKITDVSLNIDLYPGENRFEANGSYTIVNDTESKLDTILLRTGFDENTSIKWARSCNLLKEDTLMNYYLYELEGGLEKGDTIQLDFNISSVANSLLSRNSAVINNGTFLKHDILPRLEYQFSNEEKKHKHRNGICSHFYSKDADLVNLRTTISTSDDQIAIAPGKLMSKIQSSGRVNYVYQTETPVKLNFSFHSARFKSTTEEYKGISLSYYCHPNHSFNNENMLEGIKSAIDFNTKNFGPYPHEEIRIIEFPHNEESYSATLTANNIPSSEILFNINAKAMDEKINLPFYVMAHELTHEWFGNQSMPAASQGAKLLTESITEYITLMIYKNYKGKKLAQQFLKLQHKRYHKGRVKANNDEEPLCSVKSDQDYIAYGKGAVALNTIANEVGEKLMLQVLKEYLNNYGGTPDHYATAFDFIDLLKSRTDNIHHDLIDELLIDKIVYDNSLIEIVKNDKQTTSVILKSEISRTNEEKEISHFERWIEIGQYDQSDSLLQLDRVRLLPNEQEIELNILNQCSQLILDPHYLYLDTKWQNNSLNL